MIVDISGSGGRMLVPSEAGLEPGQIVEIGVEESWSQARVVWEERTLNETSKADPPLLTALVDWLQREASRMP
jgi:hypothetical protein